MLRKNEREVLRELMANPKRSDRDVASRAGVSQPTVSRTRNRLEETGVIQSYQVMPNLEKLGFEILAFTTIEPSERVKEDKAVVYAVDGGTKMFVISVHKNYHDYSTFAHSYEVHWQFLVVTSVKPMKPLSFKDIPF